jgi:hypothetical protein
MRDMTVFHLEPVLMGWCPGSAMAVPVSKNFLTGVRLMLRIVSQLAK